MQDLDRIKGGRIRQCAVCIRGLKVILIALHHAAERDAVGRLRKKNLRLDLRVYRLGEDFIERQPEQKRTEVVDIGNCAEAVEVIFGSQPGLLSAFF